MVSRTGKSQATGAGAAGPVALRFVVLLCFGSIFACGGKNLPDALKQLDSPARSKVGPANEDSRPRTIVTLSLESSVPAPAASGVDQLSDLSLPFVVQISGCASGFAPRVTSVTGADANVALYKGDTNCQAQLVSFTAFGRSWTRQGGGSLSFVAPLIYGNNIDSQTLSVTQRLSLPGTLPPAGAHAIFSISGLPTGGSERPIQVGARYPLPAALADAPNLRFWASPNGPVVSAVNNGQKTEGGRTTLSLILECATRVAGAPATCDSMPNHQAQDLTKMYVLLVANPSNSHLTYAQAYDAMYRNGKPVATEVQAARIVPPAVGYNGGFQLTLESPTDISQNPNVTLVIAYQFGMTTLDLHFTPAKPITNTTLAVPESTSK